MQFSPTSCHFLPLSSFSSSLNVRDQVSTDITQQVKKTNSMEQSPS
jgi:hypothetical protein